MTQISYAVGELFLIPLGDIINRNHLIPSIRIALAFIAISPTYTLFLYGLPVVGIILISGQLLAPLESKLTSAYERGRVISAVVSGILIGTLASRTVSGISRMIRNVATTGLCER